MSGLYETIFYITFIFVFFGIISSPIWICAGVGTLLKKRESKKLAKMEEQESKVDNLYMEQSIERLQKEANDLAFMKKVEEYGNLIGK